MKLLLDENVSYRLVARVEGAFPGTVSVNQIRLQGQPDIVIWNYAAGHGFVVVSKDEHFRQLSCDFGHPPKVIWLDVGNIGTARVAALLLGNEDRINAFEDQNEQSLLVLNSEDQEPA